MSISISKAFNSVISTKYNVLNAVIFGIICALTLFVSLTNAKTASSGQYILYILISFICGFLYFGYVSIINNNLIKGQNDAFPEPTEIIDVSINALKFISGFFVWYFIILISLIPMMVFCLIAPSLKINSVVCISILVISYLALIILCCAVFGPFILMFFENLEFKSLFAFNKITIFYKERKGNTFAYFVKTYFLLPAISLLIFLPICFVVGFFAGLAKIPLDIINIFISILGTLFFMFYSLMQAHLNAQYVNSKKTAE